VRADLPLERDLAAPERPTGSQTPAPGAEEAEQLPHRVHTEAARLDGVALEVALEEPVVELHVALGDEAAARPVAPEFDDAVEHEERGKRQARLEARRRVVDQPAVREREQLPLGEAPPLLELGIRHRYPSLTLMPRPRSAADSSPR